MPRGELVWRGAVVGAKTGGELAYACLLALAFGIDQALPVGVVCLIFVLVAPDVAAHWRPRTT